MLLESGTSSKLINFFLHFLYLIPRKSVFIMPCFVSTLYKPSTVLSCMIPKILWAHPLALSKLGIDIWLQFLRKFINFYVFCVCTMHACKSTSEAFIVCTKRAVSATTCSQIRHVCAPELSVWQIHQNLLEVEVSTFEEFSCSRSDNGPRTLSMWGSLACSLVEVTFSLLMMTFQVF